MRGTAATTDKTTHTQWEALSELTHEDFGGWVKRITPQVLVVDDEALIRWSVSETLRAHGMDVKQASDGASATRLLADQSNAFDVVVLDLRLPDVSDLSLVNKVRTLSPGSRVIVMTAFGTPEVTVRAIELGASRVIHKPFELEDLASLVEMVMSSSKTPP